MCRKFSNVSLLPNDFLQSSTSMLVFLLILGVHVRSRVAQLPISPGKTATDILDSGLKSGRAGFIIKSPDLAGFIIK